MIHKYLPFFVHLLTELKINSSLSFFSSIPVLNPYQTIPYILQKDMEYGLKVLFAIILTASEGITSHPHINQQMLNLMLN